MTKRDFYATVVKANISEEMTNEAKAFIEALDKVNSARAKAVAKKKAEANAPRISAIEGFLKANGNKPTLLTVIAKGTDLSTSTISGLAKAKVESGEWIKGTQKVVNKGTQMTLCLADIGKVED